jgi:hypothetical protein
MGDEVVRLLRDSFYVTVGFGVLGPQKLQVGRRDLERRLEPVVDDTVGRAARLLGGRRP